MTAVFQWFRVQGLGFRVWGLGFRVGWRIKDLELNDQGLGYIILDLGRGSVSKVLSVSLLTRVVGLSSIGSSLGFRVYCLRYTV